MSETNTRLTDREINFLRKLASGSHWFLRNATATAPIQSLVDRGYCRTSKERLGPLGIYTGEICITLTEAGHSALR
jgi:hypothetical protein